MNPSHQLYILAISHQLFNVGSLCTSVLKQCNNQKPNIAINATRYYVFELTAYILYTFQPKVKEEKLVEFVKELDLVLSDEHAKVMHAAAAGGLTTLIEEILVRGDTATLLQVKCEGALPFQTALKKEKYATAIVLLKDHKVYVYMPAIPYTSTSMQIPSCFSVIELIFGILAETWDNQKEERRTKKYCRKS